MAAGNSVKATLIDKDSSVDITKTWLIWQCQMVAGVIQGAIISADGEGVIRCLSSWPEDRERHPRLLTLGEEVLSTGDAIIRPKEKSVETNMGAYDLIGCPLNSGEDIVGAVVLMVSSRSDPQLHAIQQLLQWGGVWVDKLLDQRVSFKREFGTFIIHPIISALSQPSSDAFACEVVDLLADSYSCQRVSLGLHDGLSTRLISISHTKKFDARTQLVRRIEAAMEEALDQGETIIEPMDPSLRKVVSRAHREIVSQENTGAVCTLLLKGKGEHFGALMFERTADYPFDEEFLSYASSMANMVAYLIELKRNEEKSLLSRMKETVRQFVADFAGPSYLRLKVTGICLTLLLAFSVLFNGEHRVTAPASIEGSVRYMLVAPHDGYIEEAGAQAGDVVKKGQLIARLHDRGLKLELQKWQGELAKLQNIYQEALAMRNRTKLAITMAQMDQAKAELALVQGKIERTTLQSPIDGVIARGDLSQSVGAPVESGKVLYEIAPLDNYQVVLKVDEFDMAGMAAGRAGRLIVAALPGSTFPVTIEKIVPITVSADGHNYFRVEASLENPTALLRPGMEGVAKIDMGERKLFWIWTHSVIDRLRLWFWTIGL